MFSLHPETWVPCSGTILARLDQLVDTAHLQLAFRPPAHEKTRYGTLTRELSLMVKVETLQADGAYTSSVYMLKATPDSRYPVTPIQEAPKAEINRRQLRQPLIAMDSF